MQSRHFATASDGRYTTGTQGLPRVVIVGGGFGGLWAARALRGESVRVTVVDRTNHHLFQPLLYQVALAGLAPSDIAIPIRWALRRDPHAEVILGEVVAIDIRAKRLHVRCPDARDRASAAGSAAASGDRIVGPDSVPFDYLIVAAGARHAYFGHGEWERFAPGLKSLDDAREIRRRFLMAFERAERRSGLAGRDHPPAIVIVGGGPTGVELAGMASEIAHKAMPRDFRMVDTRASRIVLVEGGPRLLPAFPETLGERARTDLLKMGVEVHIGAPVTAVDADGVTVGGERIASDAVLWAAGNAASPLGRQLGAPCDRAGRVIVNSDLSVPGHPEVFVVGDAASIARSDGSVLPGVAQVAMQSGTHAARNIARLVHSGPSQPFRYRNLGDMATIGRNRAVANLPIGTFSGLLAWVMWLVIHLIKLIGFRSRATVLVQWAYAYFTFQRGARLISTRDWTSPRE